MGRQLPAVPVQAEIETGRRPAASRRGWLRSPIADAMVELVPDLVRLTRRSMRSSDDSSRLQSLSGANGMSVQEVEIEVTSPLVRRIVVRSTNSWSLSPEVALGKRRRSGRIGIGAVSVASVLLLGAAAARRAAFSLPGRPRGDS